MKQYVSYCIIAAFLMLLSQICAQENDKMDLEKRLKELTGQLQDKDDTVKNKAAKKIGEIGPQAKSATSALIAALDRALSDKSISVVKSTTEALGKIGPNAKAAGPILVKVLQMEFTAWSKNKNKLLNKGEHYKYQSAKLYAVEALGEIRFKDAGSELISAMNSGWGPLMLKAVVALGKIDLPAKTTVPAFVEAIHSNEDLKYRSGREDLYDDYVAAIIQVLKQMDKKTVTVELEKSVNSKDQKTKQTAEYILKEMGPGVR